MKNPLAIRASTVLCAITAFLPGCTAHAPHSRVSAQDSATLTSHVPGLSTTDSLNALFARLPLVPGVLGERIADFVGDRSIFEAISAFGDSAVPRLVNCLDRTDATHVTLHDRPVSLGELCVVVLDLTAYYEAFDERPLNDPQRYDPWAGDVSLPATPQQLRVAKAAWLIVLKHHGFHLL